DAGALPQAASGRLVNGLVSQRARARHDADHAWLMDVARHDADLRAARSDDARAIRPDQPGAAALQHGFDADHVEHRHALGDADDELDAGVGRFEDRVRRERRWHVNDANRGAGRALRVRDGIEDRQPEVLLAAAARRHAADHLRAVGQALLRVERALLAGQALANNFRLGVDQNAHAVPPARATTFEAASVNPVAATTSSPLSASSCRPFSTFVPSSRTTTGTPTCTWRTAASTPSAITSQRTIPPN